MNLCTIQDMEQAMVQYIAGDLNVLYAKKDATKEVMTKFQALKILTKENAAIAGLLKKTEKEKEVRLS